jgi:macrolide transport system ATP-binding/permease protein
MMRDVRYALRVLRKNPGFTTAAVLTLALGIGANAAIFSIFDAMALRPVQLPGPGRAVKLYQDMRGDFRRDVIGGPSLFSYPEYADYRDHNHVFTGLAAFAPEFRALVDADVKPVQGQLASCNYFAVMGVNPAIGRGFLPNECEATDAGPVAVISDAFWRSHFAADPNVVGRTMKLNRVPLTIIGVAPAGFTGTEIVTASYWVPLTMQWSLFGRADREPFQARDDMSWLTLLGRLKTGMSVSQARADLGIIAARRDNEAKNRVTTLLLSEPNMFARRDMREVIVKIGTVFLVAVGLVLLIACANIANLFLARATARQREIAIRLAIGASRAQLLRQLLVESLLIAFVGGALGTAVSFSSARALVSVLLLTPDIDPLAIHVMPDARVFAYALLLVAVAACAFGLVPALHATRPDLNAVLKDGAEGSGARNRLRNTFVGVQVAVSMVLLVTAGLLLRGLSNAQSVDPGFALDNTTTMTVDLHAEGYGQERAVAFHRGLGAWLKTVPGVVAYSEAATAPLAGRHYFGGFGTAGEGGKRQMQYDRVTPGFFASVGIPIVRGRDFAAPEANGQYAIVSEAAARTFWPGRDPIGQVLRGDHDYTVIGVARDAQVADLGQTHVPYLYLSASDKDALEVGTIIVRSSAPQGTVATALRAGALAQDRDLHLRIALLRDNIRSYIQTSRFLTSISGTLAAFALLLASIGIYGTVAFTVARRTREIGIRMALGAGATNVIAAVAREAMRTVATGGAIGLIICVLVTRVLERVLFGVSTLDAAAFLLVPLVLFGVALVATYIPARKAVRVDPLIALRAE